MNKRQFSATKYLLSNILIGFLGSLVLLGGCTSPPPTDSWRRLIKFRGVWGTSPTNVYAVGSGNNRTTLWHYDGSKWANIWNPSHAPFVSHAIWGTGNNDIFIVGGFWQKAGFGGNPVRQNYTSHSLVFHFDGVTWKTMRFASTQVHDVFGTGPQDVYAVAWPTKVHKYNGRIWNMETIPLYLTSSHLSFHSIWASGPEDIFVVGGYRHSFSRQENVILHYDGIEWSKMEHPYDWLLTGVWGSGPNDVFAVGDGGTILHYDGTQWQGKDRVCGSALKAIWGSGPNDVFAVGSACKIVHYDGKSWTESPMKLQSAFDKFMKGELPYTLFDVWGSGPNDVFAVGSEGTILHYDGHSWKYQ